jgi:chemotaxis protein histidine kinase CheA
MSTEMFNASVFVSEQLNRLMMNAAQDLAQRCVNECAQRYGFDADEATRQLGIHTIKIERKPSATKSSKEKKIKAPKEKTVKPAFPLPYNGEFNDACCFALRQNSGLYTQCSGSRKGDSQFCKSCDSQMMKTGAEMPEYGTIQQRQAVGVFEYVDPKGRKPIAYTKLMKKHKLTQEQVLEEAIKFNLTINSEHFVAPVEESKRGRPKTEKAPKEKGQKGRPKKSKKVLEIDDDDEDLFAALVAEANSDSDASDSTDEDSDEKPKKKISKEEKEAKKQEKEQKLAAEKAEKEAKKALEKAEKEAKKAAEKQEKEEKEAKKAAEKAEKEAEKKAKEEERIAKLAEKEAEKQAKLLAKKEKKPEKKEKKAEKKEEKAAEEPLRVKKITFEGKKYLLSASTGVVYDYEEYVNNQEQVVIGKWNEADKKVIFSKSSQDSDEEVEEEYDL